MAAATAAQEALWILQLLRDMGENTKSVQLLVDNQSAISLMNSRGMHRRTKHIDVKYHFIRDLCERDIIVVDYVPTYDQLADILTKPLPRVTFEKQRDCLSN